MSRVVPTSAWVAIAAIAAILLSVTWFNTRSVLDSPATPSVPETQPGPFERSAFNPAPSQPSVSPVLQSSQGLADLHAQQAAQEAEVKMLVETGRDRLTGQYEAERTDAAWALAKEQVLKQLATSPQIEQLDAGPTRIDAHCRTSVCRIEAEFASRRAADDWATLYPLSVGSEMPNVSLQHEWRPDGTVRIELYGSARP